MKVESNFAGRSPLRLATFSLPTHREVVAVVLSDYRFGLAPRLPPAPVRSVLRVCIPRRRELIRSSARKECHGSGCYSSEICRIQK